MKIYCNRYESNEDVFDRLIGQDTWIRVALTSYNGKDKFPYFVRVLDKSFDDDSGDVIYTCNYVYDSNSGDFSRYPTNAEDMERLTSAEYLIHASDMEIMKPLTIYTTDELLWTKGDISV